MSEQIHCTSLPDHGISWEHTLETIREYKAGDPDCMRLNANSMKGGVEVQEIGKAVFDDFFLYNALYSVMVPSIGRIEDELMGMCVEIFHGGEQGRANLTPGGTGSIFYSLHAMREWVLGILRRVDG